MVFTGDRFAILKGDHPLSSLDGESIAFCNVEGPLSPRGLLDLCRHATRHDPGLRPWAVMCSRFAAKARPVSTGQPTVSTVSRSRSPSFRPIRHRVPVMDQIENGERLDLRSFADLPGWAEKEVVGFFLAGIVSI